MFLSFLGPAGFEASSAVPVITVITFDDEVQKMPNPDEERKKLEKAAIEVTGSEKRNVFFIANSVTDQEDLASAYRKRLLQMVKQALKCGELSIKMRQNQRETPEKMKRYSRSESKPGVRPLRFPGEKTESPAINYLSEESSREAHDTNVDGTVQERKEASQREARWLENERRQREFEEKQRIEREKREKEEEQGRRAYQQKRVREIADEEKRLKLEHELCVRRDELKNYKFGVKTRLDSFRGLLIDDVTQLRIGLFGQTGSGKRCFINTCERTVRETEKGSAPDSTTGQEGTIILQDYLPEMFFRLVDIRGFFNYNADEYVEFEDILLGRLQPGDNVKRPKEGQADTPPMDLYQNTQFANRLHGVIYVVMANDARLREGHLKNYLKPVRYILRESGIAPITVVTHRDKLNTEEECENALFEASAATGSSPSHTFFVANYTKDRPKRDPKTERIIFDILHCALLMAERAVKIMKQKIKNKEEDEMMRRLEGTSVSGQVAPDSPEASVEVFLRFLQKEYQWSTNSVKQVVNKLSKDDVTSVQLLAIFWRDVQTHFPFGMRKMVGKELRNRNMIP